MPCPRPRCGSSTARSIVKAAAKVQNSEERPDNRDGYLSHVNGLPMGPSRAQGIWIQSQRTGPSWVGGGRSACT